MRRALITLVLLASVSVLMGSCAGGRAPAGETTRGGVLTISYGTDPTSLDLHRTPEVGLVHALIYDTLVTVGPDLQYHPHLAKSWTIENRGKEITFQLRDDVKFHDGTPFNAQAVKFNFDRIMDPKIASPAATWLGTLKEVQVVGDYTVKLVFDQPYSPIFYSLAQTFLGMMSPRAVQECGEEYGHKAAVGTGPFKFESWQAGQQITLVRNEDYKWPPYYYDNKGPAYLQKVVLKCIPDETTRVLAIQNGEIDIVDVPPQSVAQLKERTDLKLYEAELSSVCYLGINCSKKPWSDVRLREAVAHTINREEIIRVALNGLAVPNPTPISPAVFGYDKSLLDVAYKYDVEKAKTILADLGYKDTDGDGYVEKDGKPLTLEIMTYTTDPYPRLAEVVREQIMKAGIKVTIKTLEGATLLAVTPKGEHDSILISYGWSDPDILYYFFHSSRLDRTNRVHYVNPAMDRMLDEARTIVDAQERLNAYRKIQETLLKDAPWIPLYTPIQVTAVRTELKEFKLGPRGAYWLHDAYKEVPK
jgi:peptide/nickel transport system substrate-binding protein